MKNSHYYECKVKELFQKLYLDTGCIKERFISSEIHFTDAFLASNSDGVLPEIQEQWEDIWNELNQEPCLEMKNITRSSFYQTLHYKKKLFYEKHLHFILREYNRIVIKVQ